MALIQIDKLKLLEPQGIMGNAYSPSFSTS